MKNKGSVFCLATWFAREFLLGNAIMSFQKYLKRFPFCGFVSSFIAKVFALDGQLKVKEKSGSIFFLLKNGNPFKVMFLL